MRIGTKSLLFGVHCLPIHGWFVWAGWIRLFGWVWDPRKIISFFIHDMGYFGKRNIDGENGKQHPLLGARILHFLFDRDHSRKWYYFSLLHSRDMARERELLPSDLCYADKMALVLEPSWLYIPRAHWSGEIYEFMEAAGNIKWEKCEGKPLLKELKLAGGVRSPLRWHKAVKAYTKAQVEEALGREKGSL